MKNSVWPFSMPACTAKACHSAPSTWTRLFTPNSNLQGGFTDLGRARFGKALTSSASIPLAKLIWRAGMWRHSTLCCWHELLKRDSWSHTWMLKNHPVTAHFNSWSLRRICDIQILFTAGYSGRGAGYNDLQRDAQRFLWWASISTSLLWVM